MRARLEKAVSIARAAETCAAASGYIEKGVQLALDVEPVHYEVTTF
jgi:hypothetical protein